MKRSFIIILITFFAGKTMLAQNQFSGWLANFTTYKLSNKFSIHFDGQLRSTDQLEQVQTLLLRTGLNTHVRKNMIITAGYAYVLNRRAIDGVSGHYPEHRIWEQFIISHPLLNTSLSHRLRLEQRFIAKSYIDNEENFVNDGNVFANRFRYFFRTMVPLTGKLQDHTPFVGIQNEAFVNIGDKSVVNGEFFDQNRAFLSIGYRFNKTFDLELGYLYQYVNRGNKAFINNHILQLGGYLRL